MVFSPYVLEYIATLKSGCNRKKFDFSLESYPLVDTDALLSSSPSLIWLQLGFGLAGVVTILALHIKKWLRYIGKTDRLT